MTEQVTFFGPKAPATDLGADILGGKGYHLARMSDHGVPVPEGFTIHTTFKNSEESLVDAIKFGMSSLPVGCLFSVRSGAPVSMPGMMDTILNVGIFRDNIEDFEEKLGARTALDCYRRFLQMFGEVVHGIDGDFFENCISVIKEEEEVVSDSNLSTHALARLVDMYEELYSSNGHPLPKNLGPTLAQCASAVFASWDSERAIAYRKAHNISGNMGTAVNIQRMVFGNLNSNSATGVLFTRNPSTGESNLTGEFLWDAQGEDVVAGIRTPEKIDWDAPITWLKDLQILSLKLEVSNMDAQDIEFTVEDGKLYLLQTRSMKRTGRAAFKIAHDLAMEGVIEKKTAVRRVNGSDYASMLVPSIDPTFKSAPLVQGLAASPGIATGVVVKSSEAAKSFKGKCILVTKDTNPNDFPGMQASVGILTSTGGHTCHAAVVARGMNKSAIVGAGDLSMLEEGDVITLDGASGRVWKGEVPVIEGVASKEVNVLLAWAFELKDMNLTLAFNIVINSKEEDLFKAAAARLPNSGNVELRVADLRAVGVCGLSKLLRKIKTRKALGGVISLAGRPPIVGEGDDEFLTALGLDAITLSTSVDEKFTRHHVKDLEAKQWTAQFKARWSVRMPEGFPEYNKRLAAAGWNIVSEMSPEMVVHIHALGLTTGEFTSAVAAIGKPIFVAPVAVEFDEAVFEVLE